jgi:hypothetical protein
MLTHFSVWVVILVPHQDPVHHVTVLVYTSAQRRIETEHNKRKVRTRRGQWQKGKKIFLPNIGAVFSNKNLMFSLCCIVWPLHNQRGL